MSVKVYTTEPCGQCLTAKAILDNHGLTYDEIVLTKDPVGRDKLVELTGNYTFPQILVDDKPVGGLAELLRLEQEGELEGLAS